MRSSIHIEEDSSFWNEMSRKLKGIDMFKAPVDIFLHRRDRSIGTKGD
jgi:hypothetical protein